MESIKICTINGCNQKHKARGLCKKHYDQLPEFKERRRLHFKQLWDKDRKKMRIYYNEYVKRNKMQNAQYLIRYRLRQLLYHALERYTKTGKIMSSKKYGISYELIIKRLTPLPFRIEDLRNWNIDHIIPLSKFDLNNPEELKKAFSQENLQWLSAKENRIKYNKVMN